jgi:hypothetical protein
VSDRLSTGATELDRQFETTAGSGSGVPAGSMVVIESAPGAQVEPLVWSFMTERPTVYVPTLRDKDAVSDELDDVVANAEYSVRDVGFDTPVRDCSRAVELIDRQANVVLDPVTPLEDEGGNRYVKFLNGLKRHLTNVNGLALVLAPTVEQGSRARQHTLSVADVVWELRTEADTSAVETYLVVRKFRGGEVPDEPVSLELGQRVRVDTSRDIA